MATLAVNENEEAAAAEKVFSKIAIPFVIAGKDPSEQFADGPCQHEYLHCGQSSRLRNTDMIAKAHIHILPSLNNTGVKLKLLNALFNGRFCLVNQAAIAGYKNWRPYCHLAGSTTTFNKEIQELYETGFTEEETHRRQGLQTVYNNEVNAQRLITFLS